RALFQSWFVDFDPVRRKSENRKVRSEKSESHDLSNFSLSTSHFDHLFPDSFQSSKLGEIPKGWEVCPLSQKIEILSGGTPKTTEPAYWDGDIPWYSVKDAPSNSDVWVIQTEKNITQLGVDNSAAK